LNVTSIKLPPARSGIVAVVPVAPAGEPPVRAQRTPAPKPRAAQESFPPVATDAGCAAPILPAAPFLAQHIAQEALPAHPPVPSLAAAYLLAPSAAFEGLNYRTLA
jgi:hypothetical protein